MLQLLRVQNMALVDEVQLELGPGLTVLTGETGAGKSILITALSLVLGGRASSEVVRRGAKEAAVEALFRLEPGDELRQRLEERGFDVDGDEFLIRRTIGGGKSRVHINGQLATVGLLNELLRGVVDITSQHEHVSLLDPERHVDVLDRWAGLLKSRADVAAEALRVSGLRRELEALDADDAAKAQREDYLRFAVREIEDAAPSPGEMSSLRQDRARLQHRDKILQGQQAAVQALEGGAASASATLGTALRALSSIEAHEPRARGWVEALERAMAEVEEVVRELQAGGESAAREPGRLEAIDDRLELLRRLSRKHGKDEEAILVALQTMRGQLAELDDEESHRAELTARLESATKELRSDAHKLGEARGRGAKRFVGALRRELSELGLGGVELRFDLQPIEVGPRGGERVELLVSTNPGEPVRSLAKVASGGELSRFLLAIKQVQADRGGIQTFVFDEVDAGIGGKTADVLGEKLHEVAARGQVLCVTHLPQVAAYADAHYVVEKGRKKGRTLSQVRRVDSAARIEELARMLGSSSDAGASLARELVRKARS
ncbi:MAG: DNA repair protein RecN [Myxococcota bacterium]